MQMGALFMSMTEWGGRGNFPGFCAGPRLQVLHAFSLAQSSLHVCGDVDILTLIASS